MPIPNDAAATYTAQAEPDAGDFEIITAAHSGTGVLSGCACTPASSGVTLGVAVASGVVYVGSKTSVAVTGATVTPGAASGGNPRIDLVVASNAGALSVVAGTAAVHPLFPAIPASRVVLCAVYIPTSATSITAANIIDKRQMVNYVPADGAVTDVQVAAANKDGSAVTPSMRTLGTSSLQAASGNHIHDGAYASTAHASTHDGATGSDPISSMGNFDLTGDITQTVNDGSSSFVFQGQLADPGAPASDAYVRLWADWNAYSSRPCIRTIDNKFLFGTIHAGPDQFVMTPATGAAGLLSPFIPATHSGTLTTSTATTSLPRRTKYATAASANAVAAVFTTDVCVAAGDNYLPWNGLHLCARVNLPDASYANSGASTGVRIFVGVTDQISTVICNSDDPAGHRAGIVYRNVNGGVVNTTWRREEKDGTTKAEDDTTITVTQNHVYDLSIFLRRNIQYVGFQVDDVTAGTTTGGNLIDGRNGPFTNTMMRPMICIQTINATARAIEVVKFGWETL